MCKFWNNVQFLDKLESGPPFLDKYSSLDKSFGQIEWLKENFIERLLSTNRIVRTNRDHYVNISIVLFADKCDFF